MWGWSSYSGIVAVWVLAGLVAGAEAGLALLPFIAWAFGTLFSLDALVRLLQRARAVEAESGLADAVLSSREPAALPAQRERVLFSAAGAALLLTVVRREDGALYLRVGRQR